jgi:hypothetical protein
MSIGLSEVNEREDIIIARNLLTPPALLLDKKVVQNPLLRARLLGHLGKSCKRYQTDSKKQLDG